MINDGDNGGDEDVACGNDDNVPCVHDGDARGQAGGAVRNGNVPACVHYNVGRGDGDAGALAAQRQ